jgi:hypothetical protein
MYIPFYSLGVCRMRPRGQYLNASPCTHRSISSMRSPIIFPAASSSKIGATVTKLTTIDVPVQRLGTPRRFGKLYLTPRIIVSGLFLQLISSPILSTFGIRPEFTCLAVGSYCILALSYKQQIPVSAFTSKFCFDKDGSSPWSCHIWRGL